MRAIPILASIGSILVISAPLCGELPNRLEIVRDVCVYQPADEYGGGVPKLVRTDKGIVIEFLTQNLAALKAGPEKHPHFSPVSEKRWALSTDDGATWSISSSPPGIGKILDVGQMCGTMMPDGSRLQVLWEYKKGTRQRLPTVGRIQKGSLDKPVWEEHLLVLQNALMHSIKPHPQGGFLAATYGGGVRIFRGSQDGKDWKEICSVMPPDPFSLSEADLVAYEDGRTVLVIRADWDRRKSPTPPAGVGAGYVKSKTYGYYLYQADSTDFGQTWSEPRKLPIWGHPPYMHKLRSGNLLMVYGHRQPPYSVRAILSHDRGKTWDMDSMLTLHTFDPGNWDLGYPVAMQLDDGRVLVAFYGYTTSDATVFYSPNGQFCTTIQETK